MEELGFRFQVKAVSESGVFSGLASTYDNVDRQGDAVIRGAFTDSLAKDSSVPLLKAHDGASPIGLAKLSDSADGLMVDGQLDLNVTAGRETYSGLKGGYFRGLSIGYGVPKGGSAYRDDGVRELRKVDLYEVSVVAIPANRLARVTAVKSIGSVRDFERFLHDSGWSKREAAALASHGFKGLGTIEEEDATEDALLAFLQTQNRTRRA